MKNMKTKKFIVSFVLICVCSLSTLAYDFAAGSDVYLYYNKIGDSSVEVTNKVPNHAIDSLSSKALLKSLKKLASKSVVFSLLFSISLILSFSDFMKIIPL